MNDQLFNTNKDTDEKVENEKPKEKKKQWANVHFFSMNEKKNGKIKKNQLNDMWLVLNCNYSNEVEKSVKKRIYLHAMVFVVESICCYSFWTSIK